MQAVAEKIFVKKAVAPQAATSPKIAKLAASSRYSAPNVVSFPLKGVVRVDQISMVGNTEL